MSQLITRLIASIGPQSPVRDVQPTLPHPQEEGDEVAIFALGNFYSAEQLFLQNFSHRGLRTSSVGYIGGSKSCPTYRNVMLGGSGHALAVRLEYDPNQISYAALVEFFYRAHDPTKRNAQGPDKGTQFRSTIFCLTPQQREIAQRITSEVYKIRFARLKKTITTRIVGPEAENGGIPDWWDAEEEHQKFLFVNRGPEADALKCPTHKMHW